MGVSNFGLDANQTLRIPFNDYFAIAHIEKLNKLTLLWEKPDGKLQKSIPQSLKETYKEEIKELKKKVKDLQDILPAQKDRIERFFLKERTWNYTDWFQLYIDHHLVAYIGKRLIWTFTKNEKTTTAIYHQEQWTTSDGRIIDWIDEQTNVQLWHPIHASVTEISDWRDWLLNQQIQQPLKQAFREIYIVTEAELNTESYSNRFASHILRQHQFTALCKLRGWKYTLQGAWDSHNTPYIVLPDSNIRVEFWVDANHEGETSHSGIYNHIFTDQVRFYDSRRQLNMNEVPAIIFSELMRDVDMFVGVTSIGNDTTWQDGGNDRFNTYWRNYSVQDLTQSAKTRKEVLEKLIPRLNIVEQCSFTDKFLVVNGTVRTYKIHFGSGNILMSPNDQYLCIVADRGKQADKVFLPFEGDQMLSIILSKAFLLANDNKINDRTILSQIRL